MNENPKDDLKPLGPDGKLTSYSLAVLVVDELLRSGIVSQEHFDRAVEIAETEIEVRKVAGDY